MAVKTERKKVLAREEAKLQRKDTSFAINLTV
jgi:hypothetical protein